MENHDEEKQEVEKEAFASIEPSEQKAILFRLACVEYNHNNTATTYPKWEASSAWEQNLEWSAMDQLGLVPHLRDKLIHKENWTDAGLNADVFYARALHIAQFCRRNNLIRTFAAFDFLFVRLFGGAARPLTPSLFAASLLHPEFLFSRKDERELNEAVREHAFAALGSRSADDPVWFPNHEEPR